MYDEPGRPPPAPQHPWELSEARAVARRSRWLAGQPTSFQDALLRQASLQKYVRDEKIIGLEQAGNPLFFLLEGAVQLALPRATLEVLPVHIIASYDWFGEHGAATGKPSFVEYRARTACTALMIPRSCILAAEAEHPSHRAAILDLLSQKISSYLELAGDLTGLGVEERIRAKLFTLAGQVAQGPAGEGCILPVSQEELAAAACVSRATVHKVLNKLRQAGLVQARYRKIHILDRYALLQPPEG